MTEKEVLDLQEKSGNKEFYLMLVGKFFLAYGHGAFALSRGTGYRVMRKPRKNGFVLTCGFPIEKFDMVLLRVRDAGGQIEPLEQKLYRFSGLDGTPDERMVCETQPKAIRVSDPPVKSVESSEQRVSGCASDWLREALLSFNLSMSTPLDAMNFIGKLQQRLLHHDDAEKVQGSDDPQKDDPGIACESPSGQGLTE